MSFADACESFAAYEKAKVIHHTFGHLRVEPRKTHACRLVFTLSEYGQYTIISARVEGANDSPWLYDHMTDFACRKAKTHGRIYVFEGVYYTSKTGRGYFKGQTKSVRV